MSPVRSRSPAPSFQWSTLDANLLLSANSAHEVPRGVSEQAGTIATAIPATTDPELGELRCPNGYDSSIPPRCPALMFVACRDYSTEATWNEFCITCGVRHAPTFNLIQLPFETSEFRKLVPEGWDFFTRGSARGVYFPFYSWEQWRVGLSFNGSAQ